MTKPGLPARRKTPPLQHTSDPRQRPRSERRLRVLTAVPICDGHDSAIMTINQELSGRGGEIVYLGYHRSAEEIARAAVQEDVDAVGISSYNGGHVAFFAEVAAELRERGRPNLSIFGGGGATITKSDVSAMRVSGVRKIYGAGTPLHAIIEDVFRRFGRSSSATPILQDCSTPSTDASLARLLTIAEARAELVGEHERLLHKLGELQRSEGPASRLTAIDQRRTRAILLEIAWCDSMLAQASSHRPTPVIGFAGPGGVGKSTLIDEIILRHLRSPDGSPLDRFAVLSNDPSLPPGDSGERGALLGDRATMIYSQDDRVFQRSLATRGAGGVSDCLFQALDVLRGGGFRAIFVESAGTGQEAMPFPPGSVDATVLVLSPDYGGRLQLEKLALLRMADIVVLNKADRPGATAAAAELRVRMARADGQQRLLGSAANHHRDPGVDSVFTALRTIASGGSSA